MVAFIIERGGGISFVELGREFLEKFDGQEHAMSLTDHESIILKQLVSPAITVRSLQLEKKTTASARSLLL